MVEQIYSLKVTLSDWEARVRGQPYRVLAVPGDMSLYDLALAINGSFDFDFDHAFGFFDNLKNPYHARERYELFVDMDEEELGEEDLGEELEEEMIAGLDEDERLELDEALERMQALTEGLTPEEAKEAMIQASLEDVPETLLGAARSVIEDFLGELEEGGAEARGVRTTAVREAFAEVGKRLLYLFDYGDEWRFIVRLEETKEAEPGKSYPQLVKAVGEAPEQYPDWDDDDEDDDEDG
ncbi:MAG: plasmid pRiA4b ORF-3 family protein [Deinococcota bacterium]|nr:plasmid pRiA4b ORF-3 family protein [Deinococcota bacterium]